MAELAARHRAVAIDVGTGDGAYARRLAAADPALLVVGIDANADNLRRASRRGPANLLVARLALERAPGALQGLADRLTVLLPWGSLLRAVAEGEPDGLGRLRALCRPGAALDIVVSERDLDGVGPETLVGRYAEAGLTIAAGAIGAGEAAALGTSWAKRLARSDPERRFVRLAGAVAPAPDLSLDPGSKPGSAPRTAS